MKPPYEVQNLTAAHLDINVSPVSRSINPVLCSGVIDESENDHNYQILQLETDQDLRAHAQVISDENNGSHVVNDEDNYCGSVSYKVIGNMKNSRDVVTNEVVHNVELVEKNNIRISLSENYVQPLFTGIKYGSPASEDYMMIEPLTEYSYSPRCKIVKSENVTERDAIDAVNVENSSESPMTNNKVYDVSGEKIGGKCSVSSVVNTVGC